MRIARILTRLNLGGPARQVLASDPLLAERGHELKLFAGEAEAGEGSLDAAMRARGLDLVRVPGLRRRPQPLADLRAGRFLRAELARFAPDLVHTHASKAGWVGRRAAQAARPEAARVHSFHGHVLEGYFPAWVSRRLQAAERRLARSTDRLVAVSEATRADLVRLAIAPRERISLVRPGSDLEALLALAERPIRGALRARYRLPGDAVVIGVLGRLAPVKRPRLALEAFTAVAEADRSVWLWFAGDGDGEARELAAAIRALPEHLGRRVVQLGNVEDVAGFLAEVDLLLQSSSNEGFPVALVEAAAAARPFVATGVGGVPELAAQANCGVSVDPRGQLEGIGRRLAEGLGALVRDPQRRERMGRAGRGVAARDHSAEALAGRLEAVYEQALCARRSA